MFPSRHTERRWRHSTAALHHDGAVSGHKRPIRVQKVRLVSLFQGLVARRQKGSGNVTHSLLSRCTTRCSECQCCAYGTLLPLLPGILTSLASLFSLTSWDCNSEWLVSVLLIAILILVLLPACIRYRQPRGVRISLYIAAVLSFLCAVLKVFGAVC